MAAWYCGELIRWLRWGGAGRQATNGKRSLRESCATTLPLELSCDKLQGPVESTALNPEVTPF